MPGLLPPGIARYLARLQEEDSFLGLEEFHRRHAADLCHERTVYRWRARLGRELVAFPSFFVEALGLVHVHLFVVGPSRSWAGLAYAVEGVWVVRDWSRPVGYKVTTEYPIGNGKTVDLHATKDGSGVFVEVETGRSDVPANIHKCTGLPGTVVFFFTTRELADEYRPLLDQLGIQHVTPWDLDQFTAPE